MKQEGPSTVIAKSLLWISLGIFCVSTLIIPIESHPKVRVVRKRTLKFESMFSRSAMAVNLFLRN